MDNLTGYLLQVSILIFQIEETTHHIEECGPQVTGFPGRLAVHSCCKALASEPSSSPHRRCLLVNLQDQPVHCGHSLPGEDGQGHCILVRVHSLSSQPFIQHSSLVSCSLVSSGGASDGCHCLSTQLYLELTQIQNWLCTTMRDFCVVRPFELTSTSVPDFLRYDDTPLTRATLSAGGLYKGHGRRKSLLWPTCSCSHYQVHSFT